MWFSWVYGEKPVCHVTLWRCAPPFSAPGTKSNLNQLPRLLSHLLTWALFCVEMVCPFFTVFSWWTKKRCCCFLSVYSKLLLPCQLAQTSSQNSFQLLCQCKRPRSEGAWNTVVSEKGIFKIFLFKLQWEFGSFYSQFSRSPFSGAKRSGFSLPSCMRSWPQERHDKNTQFPFAKLTLPI